MEKIRRNQKLFRKHPKRSPLKIVLFILLCALAIFVGYSVAGPLYNFFTGSLSAPSSSEPLPDSSITDSVSQPSDTSSEPEQTAPSGGIRALCFSAEQLASDPQSVIDTVKQCGANAVLIEIKTNDGMLTYASALEAVKTAEAVPADAPSLRAALAKLKAESISAIARMSCFQDPVACRAVPDGVVLYAPNKDIMWLDNSASAGGKSWLNPYAQSAWQYLAAIAKEAVSDGFTSVLLSEVQFPNRQSSKAYFGEEAASKTREAVLSEFTAYMETQIEAAGGNVILSAPADAAAGGDVTVYGASPLTFGAKTAAIDLRVDRVTFADESTVDLEESPSSALTSVMTKLDALKTGDTSLMVWLQSGPGPALQAQIDALESAGVKDMIFYSEDGRYSGISIGTK